MNWLKVIFTASLAIVFIGSTFTALFGAGETINAGLRTYVFEVEDCRFNSSIRLAPPMEGEESLATDKPEETCEVDYNGAKRDISSGLAAFLVGAPLAFASFVVTRRMVTETRSKH